MRRKNPHLLERARQMRRQMTESEKLLWGLLRRKGLGVKFCRQEIIGPFIVDFACRKLKLVVEVDGSQHLHNPYDKKREAYLEKKGWKVLRFWNNQVLREPEAVAERIREVIEELQEER